MKRKKDCGSWTCSDCLFFLVPFKRGPATPEEPAGEPMLERPMDAKTGEMGRKGLPGVCHRYPPNGDVWSRVTHLDWCGEYEPNLERIKFDKKENLG